MSPAISQKPPDMEIVVAERSFSPGRGERDFGHPPFSLNKETADRVVAMNSPNRFCEIGSN